MQLLKLQTYRQLMHQFCIQGYDQRLELASFTSLENGQEELKENIDFLLVLFHFVRVYMVYVQIVF